MEISLELRQIVFLEIGIQGGLRFSCEDQDHDHIGPGHERVACIDKIDNNIGTGNGTNKHHARVGCNERFLIEKAVAAKEEILTLLSVVGGSNHSGE